MSVFNNIYAKKNLTVAGTSVFSNPVTVSSDISVTGNAVINGDLTIFGSTTSVVSDNVLIKDKFMIINSENTSITQTPGITEGGLAINFGTDAVVKDINIVDFVAGVEGVQKITTGAIVSLSDGDFILVNGSVSNNGLWEVHGVINSVNVFVKSITISKIVNTTITSETVTGTPKLAKVNISVFRTNNGILEVASGNNGFLTYSELTLGGSSPTLTLPKINDVSSNHTYNYIVSELSANRNIILPLLTSNDTFVFENHNQILTNKKIVQGLTSHADTPYNISITDTPIHTFTPSTSRIVSLPAVTTSTGYTFQIIMLSGLGSLVVTPLDGTIDGLSSITLDIIGQRLTITSNGSYWYIC